MDKDEFFKDLGKKIAEKADENSARQETANKNRDFIIKFISEAEPLLNSYKQNLAEKGIRVKVVTGVEFLHFSMLYNDNGHRGIEIRPSHSSFGSYELVTIFTNDDGRDMEAGSGMVVLSQLTLESLENRIQHEIKEFIYYADRHDGFN